VAQVHVDEDTGVVRVQKIWVAQDCGRAINPLALEGQIQGAVWMGMGQALSEETQYHEGLPLRANLLDYRIPTMAESPEIEVFLIESMIRWGPSAPRRAARGRCTAARRPWPTRSPTRSACAGRAAAVARARAASAAGAAARAPPGCRAPTRAGAA
jgi:xanthine dehydrogenase molybdopterin-binding subunit B